MSNDSQKVRDILGWAQNMPEAVIAMMALTDLVGDLEKRLTALEAAKPQATDLVAEIHVLEMDAYHAKGDLVEAEAEIERLIAEIERLIAEVDRLRNVNADQQELIAALRQNSADLVVSIQLLQAEAEPRKDNERTAVLESLQDENATLRSRLAATKRQADEIKRLEAVCDDLSDKLDAANATPNHTDSEKLAFARNEIDWLRNTLDEAQARIRHLEATRR